eukprot:514468-Prymnesium_polylepis.1
MTGRVGVRDCDWQGWGSQGQGWQGRRGQGGLAFARRRTVIRAGRTGAGTIGGRGDRRGAQ